MERFVEKSGAGEGNPLAEGDVHVRLFERLGGTYPDGRVP
jgi:hypothetical protein